jgi:site-specific recombinase XerD
MASASEPSQGWLFDPGIDVARLRHVQGRLMQAKRSHNTERAYAHSWSQFERWCGKAGRRALPASAETVSLFVAWCLEEGYRLKTIRLRLAAVASRHSQEGHDSPVTGEVRKLLQAAAREKTEEPAGKSALTPDQVRRICDRLEDRVPRDVRDRAIILLGFASGWRRSELAALRLADVKLEPRKGLIVRLRRSKTDQLGQGRVVGIHYGKRKETCPVRAYEAWLKVRGEWRGPLFTRINKAGEVLRDGLSGESILDIVKRCLERIGVDSASYGAHSLRSGMITAAAESGADASAIMGRSGHRSLSTVISYIRPAQVFSQNPLANVL